MQVDFYSYITLWQLHLTVIWGMVCLSVREEGGSSTREGVKRRNVESTHFIMHSTLKEGWKPSKKSLLFVEKKLLLPWVWTLGGKEKEERSLQQEKKTFSPLLPLPTYRELPFLVCLHLSPKYDPYFYTVKLGINGTFRALKSSLLPGF